MNGNKRLIVGGVVATSLMLGGAGQVLGAGLAHAVPVGEVTGAFSGPSGDQSAHALWVDVHHDLAGDMMDAEDMAHRFCANLANGHSEADLIAGAAALGIGESDAQFALHASEWHYCPSFY